MLSAQNNMVCAAKLIRHLRLVDDETEHNSLLGEITSPPTETRTVSWVNAHALNMAQKDEAYSADLLRSSILLRDGVGVSVFLRLLGKGAGLNMNGTDYIPKIVKMYRDRPIAVFGTCEPYLSKAADRIEKWGVPVATRMDGFQDFDAYAKILEEQKVELVVLGMGMPHQEKLSAYLAEHLTHPVVILNGGAILDFLSNRFPRAPRLWRRLRMEWVFRMLQEPRRLWRRYLLGGPAFIFYAARFVFAQKFRRLNVA